MKVTYLLGTFKSVYNVDVYFRTMENLERQEKRVAELEESNEDLEADMEGCSKRQIENLDFTQKISDKNAKLQSENSALSTKVNIYQCIIR